MIHPQIIKLNLRFDGGQMQSGRYSSPTFLQTLTRVSCLIMTLHSSLKITLFQCPFTVLWRLPLHQAMRFFLFTLRIRIAFFTARGLLYPSACNFLSIVLLENVRFPGPLLKMFVISSKDFVLFRLAVLESSLASRTPNSFGRPDHGKFSLLPRCV